MNVQQIATRLIQDEVVAYPTEAVFGLGCNPQSESAVKKWNVFKKKGGQIVRRMVSNICCPSKKTD